MPVSVRDPLRHRGRHLAMATIKLKKLAFGFKGAAKKFFDPGPIQFYRLIRKLTGSATIPE